MTEVVIDEIKYIEGIPSAHTSEALEAGELVRGAIVGLVVRFVEDSDEQALIELRLKNSRQGELIKKGCTIPVRRLNCFCDYYVPAHDWEDYLISQGFSHPMPQN